MATGTDRLEYTGRHECGFPVLVRQEVRATMSQSDIPEVHLRTKLTYVDMDTCENLTHCPRCGVAFPGHEAQAENFLENSGTDSGNFGNER